MFSEYDKENYIGAVNAADQMEFDLTAFDERNTNPNIKNDIINLISESNNVKKMYDNLISGTPSDNEINNFISIANLTSKKVQDFIAINDNINKVNQTIDVKIDTPDAQAIIPEVQGPVQPSLTLELIKKLGLTTLALGIGYWIYKKVKK